MDGRSSPRPPPITFGRAQSLRTKQTDAERKLWLRLRARQLNGLKFRRQHPIGRYIVDFCCPEHHLVVELDGSQHAVRVDRDQRRTAFLGRQGYRVIRYWDNEVLTDLEAALEDILRAVRSPSPQPSPSRERG